MNNMEIPKFVKWAGGKGQLLEQFASYFPEKIERYFEPFVGSGAVFFYIVQKYAPKEIFLSDINEELIITYNVIKNNVDILIERLKIHNQKHLELGKEYYLNMRAQEVEKLDEVDIAARFIYLNRTCFNGLYRVNSKGRFNVPMGAYKNPNIVQDEKLRQVSKLLQGVNIHVRKFEDIVNLARKGDFIYFDPPYDPLKNGSFTSYTKLDFKDEDQIRLRDVFKKLSDNGCLVMKSNHNTDFIRELYSEFNLNIVKAKRLINRDASKRGEIDELVITNY